MPEVRRGASQNCYGRLPLPIGKKFLAAPWKKDGELFVVLNGGEIAGRKRITIRLWRKPSISKAEDLELVGRGLAKLAGIAYEGVVLVLGFQGPVQALTAVAF